MQEVQKTLDYKAELNLIEWVWHQENRIKEHTQVEAAFSYSCEASWSWSYHTELPERQSTTNQSSVTITDAYGNTEYKEQDGWIRIPLAWPYLVEMSVKWWWSTVDITQYLRVWDNVVYQQTTNSSGTWVTNQFILNLWKYDIVSCWGDMYYSGTSATISATSDVSIKIKRI